MIIIVDSDGLIGVSNPDDIHYLKSIELLSILQKEGAKLIYPASTIAESCAILQIRLNRAVITDQIFEAVKSGSFFIEAVDQQILITAMSFLKKGRGKHATLFDGIVAAVALKYKADAIFSFDKFYKSKGFKLAFEL